MENSNDKNCCKEVQKGNKGIFAGIAYGLLPHIGCITFIIFTIAGVTAATNILKPLLLNPYFFYILIALSLIFATISAAIYLRRNGILSVSGIKRKWKYLSTLYGTTVLTNLLLFMVVFPYATNLTSNPVTGAAIGAPAQLTLQVAIPCPGHAPLITGEVAKISGVTNVKFRFPNLFDISYDSTKTSKQQILDMDVFNSYKATVTDEQVKDSGIKDEQYKSSCNCGNSCGNSCCS